MRGSHGRRADVAVCGELVWDLHAPAGASLAGARSFTRRPGGAAANVALALRRARVATAIAGSVGADVLGRALAAELAAAGVDTSALSASGRTGLVLVAADGCLGYRPASPLVPLCAPARWSGALLHVASLPRAAAAVAELAPLLERCARARGLVSIDLNARPALWRGLEIPGAARRLLARADLVKASALDLATLSLPARWDDLDALRGALSPAGVLVVSRGARATWVAGPWGRLRLAPARVGAPGPHANRKSRARQTVGAGDVLVASLLRSLSVAGERDRDFWLRATSAAQRDAARWVAHKR